MTAYLCEPEGSPPVPRPGVGDHATSLAILAGVLGALLARQQTGLGQKVDVSLLRTGLWVNATNLQTWMVTSLPTGKVSRRDNPNPLFNVYRTQEGAYIQLVVGEPDRAWAGFCAAIDRLELVEDRRFCNVAVRAQYASQLIEILDALFPTRTAAEWGERLDRHGICWGKVQSLEEVVCDPQVREAGGLARFSHPGGQEIDLIRGPIDFSRSEMPPPSAEPKLGEHTEEVLRELGLDAHTIEKLRKGRTIG